MMLRRVLVTVALLTVASVHAATPGDIKKAATRALFQAVYSGNETLVHRLLREHGSVIELDSTVGDTTLLIAALNGKHAMLEHFDVSTAPALPTKAAAFDRILRLLLKHGAPAGVMCPILDAITFRNHVGTKLLLRGMNASELDGCLRMRTTLGQNLLHDACKSAASGYARVLFRARNVANESLTRPLQAQMLISQFPEWTAFDELFKRDIDAISRDDLLRLLLDAAAGHNASLLHEMLETRDDEDRTPLLIACADGRAAAVQLLLDAGANASHASAAHGHRNCAQVADVAGFAAISAMAKAHEHVALQTVADSTMQASQVLTLLHFDERVHAAAGWATATRAELDKLHIALIERQEHETSEIACQVIDLTSMGAQAANASIRDALGSGLPFIVRGWQPAHAVSRDWSSRSSFLSRVGNLTVRVGSVPYASTYGFRARSQNISSFVSEHMQAHSIDGTERMYVFDGAVLRSRPQAFSDVVTAIPDALRHGRNHGMQQLMLGPSLSGSMPHFHGAAVNLLVFGLKLWIVYPPAHAHFAQRPALDWYRNVYLRREACGTASIGAGAQVRDSNSCAPLPHLRFLQEPGDIVYIPSHWGHAVMNLADSFAVALE